MLANLMMLALKIGHIGGCLKRHLLEGAPLRPLKIKNKHNGIFEVAVDMTPFISALP